MLAQLLAQTDPSGSLPVNNLDPNGWIAEASKHGAGTLLFALFMILCALITGLYLWKVRIPESKSLIEKDSRDAASAEKVAQALEVLGQTAQNAHASVKWRTLIATATAQDGIRYLQALTDCMEHVAANIPGGAGVQMKPQIVLMRDRLDSIEGRLASQKS